MRNSLILDRNIDKEYITNYDRTSTRKESLINSRNVDLTKIPM